MYNPLVPTLRITRIRMWSVIAICEHDHCVWRSSLVNVDDRLEAVAIANAEYRRHEAEHHRSPYEKA